MRLQRSQHGLSLIELMIAVTMGLFLVATVGTLFVSTKRSSTQNDQTTYIQDNGRYAVNALVENLAAVDYWGGMTDPSDITFTAAEVAVTGTECGVGSGWTYNTTVSLSYLYIPSSTTVTATFPCITAFTATTDLLLIKRVRGRSETTLVDDEIYLRTNRTTGRFFKEDTSEAAKTSTEFDWSYYVHLYHINNTQLQRKSLKKSTIAGGQPTMTTDTIAEGIEYFHVEFGLDTDGDNAANYYSSSPSNADLENAVTARVHVLVRGDRQITGYSNTKTYSLGDVTRGPFTDGYYRRVFSASTPLRNMVSTRQFGES